LLKITSTVVFPYEYAVCHSNLNLKYFLF